MEKVRLYDPLFHHDENGMALSVHDPSQWCSGSYDLSSRNRSHYNAQSSFNHDDIRSCVGGRSEAHDGIAIHRTLDEPKWIDFHNIINISASRIYC